MSISLAQLGLALAAGGLTTLSPCVLPILPLVIGGATQRHRFAPILLAAGLISSFVLLGVTVGVLGDAFDLDTDLIRQLGAWMLVLFGIVMLLPFLSKHFSGALSPIANTAHHLSTRFNTQSPWGSFFLGGLLGMVWSPCSGPLLASTLALVASEGGAGRGAMILGVFGLGAATPLIMIAYASRAGFNRSRDWFLKHIDGLKKGFAVLIIAVGVSILMGWDKQIESYFVNSLPQAWVNLTTMF